MNKKLNILFTGPMPPPAGGISIHLQRLNHLLQPEFNTDFIDESANIKKEFFNIRSFHPWIYFKKIKRADIVFIHSGNRLFKKIHILSSKILGKKIITTLHGYGNERNFFFRKLDSFFFNLCHKIILVNDAIATKLDLNQEKCIVRHAFLPPIIENEPLLPNTLKSWILGVREKGYQIVCSNASRLDNFNGEDLYGLDMVLKLAIKAEKEKNKYCFIYVVSDLEQGKEKFNNALETIQSNRLENRILLINDRISFVRLIQEADVVLRPTNTDGDALTIREGLYLNKKVVASDVVSRPEGTILFKTRDQQDLENKLFNLSIEKQSAIDPSTSDSDQHQAFYANLMNELIKK